MTLLALLKWNRAELPGDKDSYPYSARFPETPDDGKVSVVSACLEGRCAKRVLSLPHSLIMVDEHTIEQIVSYLDTGSYIAWSNLHRAGLPVC